jgi:DNA-binding response OmpR family regulator
VKVDVPPRSEVVAERARHPGDVLLVEDDDLVRYALRRLLVASHRPCLVTASVEEAQQVLAAHAPSLVLTDYNLAGHWTGIDGDPEEIRGRLAAEGLGDVEVIAKPFEPGELLAKLDRAPPTP